MSAKDMFGELGYETKESRYKGKLVSILYDDNYKFSSKIEFNLESEMIKVYCLTNNAGNFDIGILQAINQQCKELGWID